MVDQVKNGTEMQAESTSRDWPKPNEYDEQASSTDFIRFEGTKIKLDAEDTMAIFPDLAGRLANCTSTTDWAFEHTGSGVQDGDLELLK